MNLKNHKTQGGDCAAFTIPSGFDRSVSIRKICNIVINLLVYVIVHTQGPFQTTNTIAFNIRSKHDQGPSHSFHLELVFERLQTISEKGYLFWNFMTVWCIVSDDERTKVNTSALLSFVCCAQRAVDSFRNSAVHTDRIKCRQKMLCRIWKYSTRWIMDVCFTMSQVKKKLCYIILQSIPSLAGVRFY